MASKSLTFELFGADRTASSAINGVSRAGDNMGKVVSRGAFIAGAALAASAVAAVAFSVDSIKAFAEAEQAQNRLAFALEKYPALIGANITEFQKMNTALQQNTRFEDDSIAAAQGALAMYDLTADQLKELTPLLLDYAAATGKDANDAANDLGQAILGQGRALKAVGLRFEDAGDPLSNYTQLVAGLRTQVQGFAEKDAETVAGRLDQINNQFGDTQEKLGAAFLPGLTLAADIVESTLMPQLDQMISRLGPELEAELEEMAPRIESAVNASIPALERLLDAVPDIVGGIADSISADLGPDGIFGGFGENGVVTQYQKIVDDLVNENRELGFDWGRTIDAMSQAWDLAWDGNADTAQNKSEEIKATWRMGLYDMRLAVAETDMATAGWQFAQGFADGITTNSEAAVLAAERMALRARDKVVNAMQIQSPSKVMRDLGAYIPQGLALGIEDDSWRVGAAFENMGGLGATPSATVGSSATGGSSVVINVPGGFVGNEDQLAKTVVRAIQNARSRGQISAGALA